MSRALLRHRRVTLTSRDPAEALLVSYSRWPPRRGRHTYLELSLPPGRVHEAASRELRGVTGRGAAAQASGWACGAVTDAVARDPGTVGVMRYLELDLLKCV